MANQLEITYQFEIDAWKITSRVLDSSDADFPRKVFLWTVASDGSLDKFQAIGHADQVAKYPEYDSNRKSNFGIRLVRHDMSEQRVATEAERDRVIIVLKSAFRLLLESFDAADDPVKEVYP